MLLLDVQLEFVDALFVLNAAAGLMHLCADTGCRGNGDQVVDQRSRHVAAGDGDRVCRRCGLALAVLLPAFFLLFFSLLFGQRGFEHFGEIFSGLASAAAFLFTARAFDLKPGHRLNSVDIHDLARFPHLY